MLPKKIHDFILVLKEKTDSGEIIWDSDQDESSVTSIYNGNKITLKYRFDENKECGIYILQITDKKGAFGGFDANENDEVLDFNFLKNIYDEAQASGLELGD